ncbi:MAG: transcriptional regulator [Methylococcaceae bacterium]|nr:transcriptional regulator [Methylococcaceae bacterium]
MHLAITALGKPPTHFIADILEAITNCHCNILELRSTNLAQSAIAAYLLVEGNWNHLAKLENILNSLQKRLKIQIHTQHTKPLEIENEYISYRLKTISIDKPNITEDIVTFLCTHNIKIEEIKAYSQPDYYSQSPIYSMHFMVLIPNDIQLAFFREEIFNFCNTLNMDILFEPDRQLQNDE